MDQGPELLDQGVEACSGLKVSVMEASRRRWIDENSVLAAAKRLPQGDNRERRAQQPPEDRPLESSVFHYLAFIIET